MDTITAEDFAALDGLEGWRVIDGMACAYFDTRDFAAGAAFVAKIAGLADAADHHPDVDLRYRGVTVRVVTHSAGGLTAKDVSLAREITAAAAASGVAADPEHLTPRA